MKSEKEFEKDLEAIITMYRDEYNKKRWDESDEIYKKKQEEFKETIQNIHSIKKNEEKIFENGNFSITGKIGKSYLISEYIINKLQKESKIRIIALEDNQKNFAKIVGGEFFDFRESEDLCLNFFTNIDIKYNGRIADISKVVDSVKRMIDPLDEIKIKPEIDIYIEKAIKKAIKKKGRDAGMIDVLKELKKQKTNNDLDKIVTLLYPYGNKDGEYFNLFNGKNNIILNNDLVVFNLTENNKLNQVIFNELMNIINKESWMSSRQQEKSLIIENGEEILNVKSSREIIKKTLKNNERHNANCIVTFSEKHKMTSEFEKNYILDTIYRNKIKSSVLINTNQKDILKSENRSQFHWILTVHPKDSKFIYDERVEKNISELEARKNLSKKENKA